MTDDDVTLLAALTAAFPEAQKDAKFFFVTDDDQSVWGQLRRALEAHQVFGKGRQVFAGAHQFQLHPQMLASHIGRALKARGPQDTLRWLYELFTLKKFVSRRCAELIGVQVKSQLQFVNGVRILPFNEMRASWHATQLQNFYNSARPMIKFEHYDVAGMIQLAEETFSENLKNLDADYSDLFDVACAITLVEAVAAPVIGAVWSEYENEDYADAEVGWSHQPARYEGRAPTFRTIILGEEHVPMINRFLRLGGKSKRACTTAANRLNSARRRVAAGDGAIDLATAFEALLLIGEEKGEINYRVKLRAALLLGTTFDERLQISKQMGELYTLRSKVVHGASLATNNAKDLEIVQWGSLSCQRLLHEVVDAGKLADMKKLELTGDPNFAFS